MSILSWIPGFQRESGNLWRLPGQEGEGPKKKQASHRGYAGSLFLNLFHNSQPGIGYSSLAQTPTQTALQKYLGKGEYPSFESVAMFESSFLQVTRSGRHVFIHNHGNEAIVGIATTNVHLPLPNLMFIARPVADQHSAKPHGEEPMLTRILPLKFVRISIYDPKKQLIKIKLISGRSYYLQFYASTEEEEAQFERWLSLVYLLHHPPPCYLKPHPTSCTVLDNLSVQVIPSEEETEEDERRQQRPGKSKSQKQEKNKGQRQEKNKEQNQEKDAVWKQVRSQCFKSRSQQQRDLGKGFGQSQSIEEEDFSEVEKQILQAKLVCGNLRDESFETYRSTTTRPSRWFKSESSLSESLTDTTSSMSSLPPPTPKIPVPKREGSSSPNIVTIFSAVSETLESDQMREKN